jgi:hypothetical protein
MAARLSKYDGALIGTALGLVVAYPSWASSIRNFFTDLIPATWDWFGTSTVNILIIGFFVLLGYIFDRT